MAVRPAGRREAGLTARNVAHLATLLVLTGVLAAVMIGRLGWFEEATFPRCRAVLVALGIVLQLNSVYNSITEWREQDESLRRLAEAKREKRAEQRRKRAAAAARSG